eukprot:gnl/MRDRNA2_/MRDRNA2_102830_c0_seq1.p1 gnl/MRDRNA2_/MRDRNA2_102830_c0~~gnl/MRDRNA2_/MRDRNA2_102830_c0_seq1.p1  ORF type:complete len:762 (-),score=138.66 gnl/MRDRNA2_/MRDRNA2_102830_c0_seq1:161-2446(-)
MQPLMKRTDSRNPSKDGHCSYENDHPPSFYCPISVQCMHDPVVLSDGHSYERRHILRWLQDHNTSPVSGLKLKQKCVFPNHALRNGIEEYFQKVFKSQRRKIRKSLRTQQSFGSNGPLLETMDELMQCSLLKNGDLSTESALRSIMEEAKILVGAEVASVFLVDHMKKQLYSTVNSTGAELRIPISSGIAGHVATTGESVLVEDAYNDDRFDRSVDHRTGFRTRTIICVPIKTQKGHILGVTQLINRTDKGTLTTYHSSEGCNPEKEAPVFSAEDLHFLRVFAAQAATAIENDPSFETSTSTPTSESEPEVKPNISSQALPSLVLPSLSPKNKRLSSTSTRSSSGLSTDSKKKAHVSFDAVMGESNKDAQATETLVTSGSQSLDSPCASPSNSVTADYSHNSVINDDSKHEKVKAKIDCILEEACASWQMDAWALNSATGSKPLSTLACYLFQHHGLIEHFGIDQGCLQKFFEEIEKGYDDGEGIPYHNRVHATSVLHLTHMLLTHGGVGKFLGSDAKLEVMACLLAAAIHDHGHRGVSNLFLVKTNDDWALRYNDQHVNEHHHASSAFFILNRPEYNFLRHRSADEYRRLRNLIISLVLGTDMAQDKKIVASFTKISEGFAQSERDMAQDSKLDAGVTLSEEDKLVMLQMMLKCADVGHLTLQWSDHLLWVERLETEFFAQGDKERELNLEISFLMDREKPGVTKSQIGFFDYVALPLYQTLTKAFPMTEPMLLGVQANYEKWSEIEKIKMKKAQRNTVG